MARIFVLAEITRALPLHGSIPGWADQSRQTGEVMRHESVNKQKIRRHKGGSIPRGKEGKLTTILIASIAVIGILVWIFHSQQAGATHVIASSAVPSFQPTIAKLPPAPIHLFNV
jgi:hypothetical protein